MRGGGWRGWGTIKSGEADSGRTEGAEKKTVRGRRPDGDQKIAIGGGNRRKG